MGINLTVPTNTETPDLKPRITVVGVGGAGGNAVNNMIQRELGGVDFVVTNTDAQALTQSKAERRIQLGAHLTQGLGAGAKPEIGRAAAEEAVEGVLEELHGSHMAFVAAGMGGGTGTGAAPVIAKAARDAGILTVGVVTKPFQFEGSHRMKMAEEGIEELEQYVDTLIIIPNQNLFRIANESTTFSDAFAMADQVLYSGVRGVTDLIVMPGLINLDFADIRSVMSQMGKAMMGTGEAEGERRALDAAEAAIANPLLEDTSMKGAQGVLINITGSNDITLFEVDEAATRIRSEVDDDAHIIVGSAFDPSLEGVMRVSVVATGIDADASRMPAPITLNVTEERHTPVVSEEEQDSIKEAIQDAVAETPMSEVAALPEVSESDVTAGSTDEEKISSALEQLFEQSEPVSEESPANKEEDEISAPSLEMEKENVLVTDTDDSPVIESQDKIVEEKEDTPSEPVTAAPAVGATDAFIPPKPATAKAQEEAAKPDPFRVADMANGGGQASDDNGTQSEPRRPSLFERVTRSGLAAIDRVSGAESTQVTDIADKRQPAEPKLTASPTPTPGMAPPPLQKAAAAQGEMAGLASQPVVQEQEEAAPDDLDIPAFLRRQAN
jgi:cell division protein FtsZ